MTRIFITIIIVLIEPFLKLFSKFFLLAFNLNGNASSEIIRGKFYGWYWRCNDLRIGENTTFIYPQNIRIGNRVSVYNDVEIIAYKNSEIVIGDDTHISKGSIISGIGGVIIGKKCAISSGVRIYTISNDFKKKELPIIEQRKILPVAIENNVLIGANVVILPGVIIGQNSVVGAGSVVSKDIAPNVVAGGQPAKFLKNR